MEQNKYTTIGIDPGLCNVGLSSATYYVDRSQLRFYNECISTKGLRGQARIAYIHMNILGFLRGISNAKYIAIENYDYKGFKLVEMAEISGVIKLLCHQEGLEIVTVPPLSLKKFVTGASQATKKMMMKNYNEDNEHIADAMGLAELMMAYKGYMPCKGRHRLEAIRDIAKGGKAKSSKKKTTKTDSLHSLMENPDVLV